ncbi:MAG: Dihydroorotate dehydrogenase B (NAD(+)), electron transfer subunit [Phycisphaerae bacterium]|nr:Dihydroorotate dehydrogenase B (NAD(+)), electron transfer subunit [Phycisphaerae bacterium]
MFRILDARQLASDVKCFRIDAPLVARHRQPGQFVIIRLSETGERIPLTMANADRAAGTIELIVKAIGKTTRELCKKNAGDTISDVMGPLGNPTEIIKAAHAVLVGGGVGTAVIYPLAQTLRDGGSFVSAITGGRTRELVVLEAELRNVCDVVYACTDDGSYGFRGTVADKLRELIDPARRRRESSIAPERHANAGAACRPVEVVYCAGPVPMMKAIAELTRPAGIKTIVSLNPIMVDGTGMCGGCRVTIDGQAKFACVDGPEFDGHAVNFAELADRLTAYRVQEKLALDRMEHECDMAT